MGEPEQMVSMLFGFIVSQAIRALVELSVADHLAEGPLTAAEIAQREGSALDSTYRLMRAGVAIGLLTIDDDERFHSTALLGTVRKDNPRSLRGFALGLTNAAHWLPWGRFVTTVRTGRNQTEEVLGAPLFEYLQQHREDADEFTAGMQSLTAAWTTDDLISQLDTDGVGLTVDVGGRDGALTRRLQRDNPALRGIVFDRPDVAQALRSEIADQRTDVVGGDFFEALPAADLYTLKFILHDWDDESCVRILRCCRNSMEPGARVAIIDFLVDSHERDVTALMDLNMLTVPGGRERTLDEVDALLTKAGLVRSAVRTSSDSPQRIVEAVATAP